MSNKPSKPAPSGVSRVAAARAGGRSRTTTYLVVGVVMVIGIALVVAVAATSGSKDTAKPTTAAERTTILGKVSSVPDATYDAVGVGSIRALPQPTGGAPLTSGGKPEVLYIGAEYCPYCAAERWGLATALARFGTLKGVGTTHSASADVYPDTATLTFHGATYTSDHLTFTAVEAESNEPAAGGGYEALDTVTAAQEATWVALSPQKSYPFIDIGGKYFISGASFDPAALQGQTATEIAAELANPTSPVSKAVIGTANAITAAICAATDAQPAAVCTSAAVKAFAGQLATS